MPLSVPSDARLSPGGRTPESRWNVCRPGPQPEPSLSRKLIEYGAPTVPAGHVFVFSPAIVGQVSSEMPPAGASDAIVRTAMRARISADRVMDHLFLPVPAHPPRTYLEVSGPESSLERHYGTLLDGAQAGIVSRLDAFDAELSEAAEKAALASPGGGGPSTRATAALPRLDPSARLCLRWSDRCRRVPTRDSPRRSGSGWSEAIGSARPRTWRIAP